MRKNIDLSKEAVKALALEAVKNDTVFKLYVESLLEAHAKKLIALEKIKTLTQPKNEKG